MAPDSGAFSVENGGLPVSVLSRCRFYGRTIPWGGGWWSGRLGRRLGWPGLKGATSPDQTGSYGIIPQRSPARARDELGGFDPGRIARGCVKVTTCLAEAPASPRSAPGGSMDPGWWGSHATAQCLGTCSLLAWRPRRGLWLSCRKASVLLQSATVRPECGVVVLGSLDTHCANGANFSSVLEASHLDAWIAGVGLSPAATGDHDVVAGWLSRYADGCKQAQNVGTHHRLRGGREHCITHYGHGHGTLHYYH